MWEAMQFPKCDLKTFDKLFEFAACQSAKSPHCLNFKTQLKTFVFWQAFSQTR